MAMTVVPSSMFIRRTPLVWRPALRTDFAVVRMTPPPRGDGVELGVVVDDERADQFTASTIVGDRQHTLAAATLHRVVVHTGPLGVPAGRGDQQVGALADDVQ